MKERKAAKKLRELADELEKNMPDGKDFARELENSSQRHFLLSKSKYIRCVCRACRSPAFIYLSALNEYATL